MEFTKGERCGAGGVRDCESALIVEMGTDHSTHFFALRNTH